MEDFKETILNIAKEISDIREIKLHDIPDIDLYMDQITSFMDNRLSSLKRNDEDIILTKTMINNYVKSKVLLPPEKKKYGRQHMIMLIWIYYFKQILSINDIGDLLSSFNDAETKNRNKTNLEALYEKFLTLQNDENQRFYNDLENNMVQDESLIHNEGDKDQILTLVMKLIIDANIQKRMAEKIIDTYFKTENK